ncbi:hypothetical protein VM1G_02363 [Cytospora mali]|uniref:Uncharacterized protein n=1 Tax=Cytospora mali TaxID=578113 RepID=A0A194VRJ7_CYTMA|nr:hypothetical protein VM1G_02363 [Valsa mali]
MDTYLLKAAVLYALSATQQTTTLVDEFLQNSSFANADLDPLTYELFDLRTPLERLGDSDLVIPARLQPPILAVIRGCGDALARVDAVLGEFADGPLQDALWEDKAPEVRELKDGLQTCRRTLQLALEVVNLAAAKDVGADTETFTTYLDQDTSRVLALIRRTLQQVQGGEGKVALNSTLRQALDDIRLYVQSLCRTPNTREEARPTSPPAIAAEPLVDEYNEDASTVVTSMIPEYTPIESQRLDSPLPIGSGLRPAKKLSHAIARWSLSTPKKSNATSTLTSTVSSFSRPSSALSSPKIRDDDEASSIEISAPQTTSTSRQASHTSHRSQNSVRSSTSSSQGSRIVSSSSVPFGLFPPMPPPRNPRRSTLISMDENVTLLPSPPTPFDPTLSTPPAPFDQVSVAGSGTSHSSSKHESGGITPLPLFAVSPPDKIYIDPNDIPIHHDHRHSPGAIGLVRTKLLPFNEKGSGHAVTVFHADTSPASYILASKHGDKTIKIHGLPQWNIQSTLKVNFYVNMQQRSRDFFVTSHSILSETSTLVAVASGFGHSLEIWNWIRKKKLQTIESAYRWATTRIDIYEANFPPLACYRDTMDVIDLYPVVKDSSSTDSKGSSKKPFGKPTTIELYKSGLPHIPKFPELAYSSTAPLLVAAAGPRPPRPGHPPPAHSAILVAWGLDSNPVKQSSRPCRSCMPKHKELETALPCGLATHGSVAVSIWIPNNVRVIGRPGCWQVEPVAVAHRYVLVWNLATNNTRAFAIPDENTIACISANCRYVAYRQGPGADTGKGGTRNCLVILDALNGGRELWRTPAVGGGTGLEGGSEQLLDLSRVTSISFSADGKLFLVGDVDGSVGVYEIRDGDEDGIDVVRQ